MPTPLNVTQQYDAPASEVFALFNDPDFIAGRLEDSGAPDAQVMTVDSTADGVKIVTRQSIPSSVLPSMVASMIPGRPGHRAHRGLEGRRRQLRRGVLGDRQGRAGHDQGHHDAVARR